MTKNTHLREASLYLTSDTAKSCTWIFEKSKINLYPLVCEIVNLKFPKDLNKDLQV